jgi:hypothetical protein
MTDEWQSLKVYKDSDGSVMRSHLTTTGLLFLTLSDDTCSFQDFFPGFEEKTAHADFTQIPLRRPLKYTSSNNWKATVDAYQECLHCAYAHPEFAKIYKPSAYQVVDHHNYSQHIVAPTSSSPSSQEEGLFFFLFPNCTLSLYAGGLTCWRINPTDVPGESRMEFDYYHRALVGSEEFESYYKFTRNVAIEDIELCEKTQANFNIGIYSQGLLNPQKENGVACKSKPLLAGPSSQKSLQCLVDFHSRVVAMCSEQLEEDQAKQGTPTPTSIRTAALSAVTA